MIILIMIRKEVPAMEMQEIIHASIILKLKNTNGGFRLKKMRHITTKDYAQIRMMIKEIIYMVKKKYGTLIRLKQRIRLQFLAWRIEKMAFRYLIKTEE